MKKILPLWIISTTLFVSLFSACSNTGNNFVESDYPWSIGNESELNFGDNIGIFLELDKESLSSTGGDFILRNSGSEVIWYGMEYLIEMQNKGKWYEIDKYIDWTLEAFTINPGEEIVLSVDWSNFYGELPIGVYRFVKPLVIPSTMESMYVNCEFKIVEE